MRRETGNNLIGNAKSSPPSITITLEEDLNRALPDEVERKLLEALRVVCLFAPTLLDLNEPHPRLAVLQMRGEANVPRACNPNTDRPLGSCRGA